MLTLIIALIVLIVGYLVIIQRKLVHLDENCYNALSQISVQTNSRWEAIQSLLTLLKKYSEYEYNTLNDIVERRQNIQPTSDVKMIGEEDKKIKDTIKSLQIIAESYPELKTDQLYIKTMESLNQYEDQVRYSRMVYNDTVTKFNRKIRQLPASIFAGLLGFNQLKDYLEFDEEKEQMPSMD